jgi:hypothetical protein
MRIKYFLTRYKKIIMVGGVSLGLVLGSGLAAASYLKYTQVSQEAQLNRIKAQETTLKLASLNGELISVSASLSAILQDDQYLRNNQLEAEINQIKQQYMEAAKTYETLVEFRTQSTKTASLDAKFAKILKLLAQSNWASASAETKTLTSDIKSEQEKLAATFKIPENVPVNNSPPGSGFSRQQVQTDNGTFMVTIISADLNSTKVVVDTASNGTCSNDCPVLALGDYVSRSGAFAGINGPYFCPATYPSCAGKTNSFDTLLMNKNKVYFNSDNNVYSSVPAVIFSGNSARFVGRSSDWGRDTGVDSVIAAQPMLVSNGQSVFGGHSDPKKGSKGTRGFIGATGNTVYIGFVHNATVAESALTLAKMGIQNALNLDSGGSVALWFGGYKLGPGRGLPFGILLVRK